MQYQEAKEFLEKIGIDIVLNDTLKLYLIVLDESYVYVKPEDLEKFDIAGFKTFVAKVLLQYQSGNPYIVYH